MKKILNAIIILTILITTLNVFTFSSFRYENTPFLQENTIVITNDSNLSSKDYIELLNDSADQYGVYPVFQEINIDDSTKKEIVYYTNYQGALPSDYPSFFSTTKQVPFDQIDKFDLSMIQVALFGNKDNFKKFTDNLTSNGLSIAPTDYNPESYLKRENIQALFILFVFNLVFMYIYVQTRKKKYAILKLEGYSPKKTVLMEIKQFTAVSIILALLIISLIFILSIKYEIGFSLYFLKSELIIVMLYLLFIILSMVVVDEQFKKTDIYSMKNNIINPGQPIILMIFSVVVTFLFLNTSIELFKNITNYQSTSAQYEKVSKMYEYSTVPHYSNINDSKTEEDDETFSDAFFNFYFLTKDDLDGTIADYYPYDYPDKYAFNINPNYLKKQAIYDVDGKRITAEDAPQGLTNLIPESKVATNTRENTDNVIVIKDDQELKFLNNRSGEIKTTSNYAAITLVNYNSLDEFKSNLEKDMASNAIIPAMSKGNYYIKTDRDDPNAVTEPYIKAANAENFIRQTPLIGNDLLKTKIFIKNRIDAYAIMFVMTLIMLIIIMINANKAIILTARKKLSLMYLETSKKPRLYKNLIVVNMILYILIGAGLWYFKQSILALILTFIICAFYLISIKVLYKQNIIKNISNNIKGDV